MRLFLGFISIMIFLFTSANAQTEHQFSGWFMLLNNNRLNSRWGTHLDIQLRSADQISYLRNFLFRPGLTYHINDKNEVTLGYLLNQTFNQLDEDRDYNLTEHRIWEQYIFKQKINTITLSHRFRYEQRFIEQLENKNVTSQRLRYFFRFIIPLKSGMQNFENGIFAALQNEIFFNVKNKSKLNNHFFDQNRSYLAVGYRFSKKMDLEAGYLNQATKGLNNNTINNIAQLVFYTRF